MPRRRASASCWCSAICRAPAAQDSVPLAARKALTDMKDFLPYKCYRLLDAAWIIGSDVRTGGDAAARARTSRSTSSSCASSPTLHAGDRGAQPDRACPCGSSCARPATSRRSTSGRTPLHPQGSRQGAIRRSLEISREIFQLERERDDLQLTIAQGAQAGRSRHRRSGSRCKRLEQAAAAVTRRISGSEAVARRPRRRRRPAATVIDTSFRMDVGETVVVGTSQVERRQQGADRAADRDRRSREGLDEVVERYNQRVANASARRRPSEGRGAADRASRARAPSPPRCAHAASLPRMRRRRAASWRSCERSIRTPTPSCTSERRTSCSSRRSSRRSAPTSASTRSRRRCSRAIRTRARWRGATTAELEPQIQSTGFFRAKSQVARSAWRPRSSSSTAARCRHDGGARRSCRASAARPRTSCSATRSACPGCRSIATCCASPTASASRSRDDPEVVEQQLCAAMPPADGRVTSDTLILHGRRICKPRPLCERCAVRDDCDYYRAVMRGAVPKPQRAERRRRQAKRAPAKSPRRRAAERRSRDERT